MADLDVKKISELEPINGSSTSFSDRLRMLLKSSSMLLPLADPNGELDAGSIPDTYKLDMAQLVELLGVSSLDSIKATADTLKAGSSRVVFVDYGHSKSVDSNGKTLAYAYPTLSEALGNNAEENLTFLCFGRSEAETVSASIPDGTTVVDMCASGSELVLNSAIGGNLGVLSSGDVKIGSGSTTSSVGNVSVRAAKVTVSGSFNVRDIVVDAGSVVVENSFTATGSMALRSPSVTVAMTGTCSLSASSVSVDAGVLEVQGTLSVGGDSVFTLGTLKSGTLTTQSSSDRMSVRVGEVKSTGTWLSANQGSATAFVGSSSGSVSGSVAVTYAGVFPKTFDAVVTSEPEFRSAMSDGTVTSVFVKGSLTVNGSGSVSVVFPTAGTKFKVVYSEYPISLGSGMSSSEAGNVYFRNEVSVSGNVGVVGATFYFSRLTVADGATLTSSTAGFYEKKLGSGTVEGLTQDYWMTNHEQVKPDWNAPAGSAAEILNKPVIPEGVAVDQQYDSTSTNPQSGTAVAQAVGGLADADSVGEVSAKAENNRSDIDRLSKQGHTQVTNSDGTVVVNETEVVNEVEESTAETFYIGGSVGQAEMRDLTFSHQYSELVSVTGSFGGMVEVEGTPQNEGEYVRTLGGITVLLSGGNSVTATYKYTDRVTSVSYDISGAVTVPQVEIVSPDGSIRVDSTINTGTNVKTFSIYNGNDIQYGRFTGGFTLSPSVLATEGLGSMEEGNVPFSEGSYRFKSGVVDVSASLTVTMAETADDIANLDVYLVVNGMQKKLGSFVLDASLFYGQHLHLCGTADVANDNSPITLMLMCSKGCDVTTDITLHTLAYGTVVGSSSTKYVEDSGVYEIDTEAQTMYPKVSTHGYGDFEGNGNIESVTLSGSPVVEDSVRVTSTLSGEESRSGITEPSVRFTIDSSVQAVRVSGTQSASFTSSNVTHDMLLADESTVTYEIPSGNTFSRVYSASRAVWTRVQSASALVAGTYFLSGSTLQLRGFAEEYVTVELCSDSTETGTFSVDYEGLSFTVYPDRQRYVRYVTTDGTVQSVKFTSNDTRVSMRSDLVETWVQKDSLAEVVAYGDYYYDASSQTLKVLGEEGDLLAVEYTIASHGYSYSDTVAWVPDMSTAELEVGILCTVSSVSGSSLGAYTSVDSISEMHEGTYYHDDVSGIVYLSGSLSDSEDISVTYSRDAVMEEVTATWDSVYQDSDWNRVSSVAEVVNNHDYYVNCDTGEVTFRASAKASFAYPESITLTYDSFGGVLDGMYLTYELNGSNVTLDYHLGDGTFYKFAVMPSLTLGGTTYTVNKLRFRLGNPAAGYLEQAAWEMVNVPAAVVSTEVFVGEAAVNYGVNFPEQYSPTDVYQVSVCNGKAACMAYSPINAENNVYNFQIVNG